MNYRRVNASTLNTRELLYHLAHHAKWIIVRRTRYYKQYTSIEIVNPGQYHDLDELPSHIRYLEWERGVEWEFTVTLSHFLTIAKMEFDITNNTIDNV